ncbi:MAG TPA: Crp/Fnr family transcriptional regulator, partial [Candidatus Sumerlaeota bacterium]|nr:Crp/Fnr family transcriptional regulator [Candidatus Sumerlaeota bacterium]HPS01400.1 Crp/Fnr family transcriptional regulator [Candidatus Sumerlaeota bacterium]
MKTHRATPEERAGKLASSPLFSGLLPVHLAEVATIVQLRSYAGGDMLFAQDDPARGFFVIIQGEVKVCRLSPDGREQVLHLLGAGETCGEAAVFEGTCYPATALALRKLECLYVPRAEFAQLAERQPAILLQMLALLSRRLRHFVRLVDDLSLKEVSSRLARRLLEMSVQRNDTARIHLDSTKSVLASSLGATSETLSRTFARLQARSLIKVEGREIALLDLPSLRRLAEGEKA